MLGIMPSAGSRNSQGPVPTGLVVHDSVIITQIKWKPMLSFRAFEENYDGNGVIQSWPCQGGQHGFSEEDLKDEQGLTRSKGKKIQSRQQEQNVQRPCGGEAG